MCSSRSLRTASLARNFVDLSHRDRVHPPALTRRLPNSCRAGVVEHVAPSSVEMLDELDGVLRPCRSAWSELPLALDQGHAAQIVAVVLDQVEGVELDLVFVLARMQAVEIGHPVDAQRRKCCGFEARPVPWLGTRDLR